MKSAATACHHGAERDHPPAGLGRRGVPDGIEGLGRARHEEGGHPDEERELGGGRPGEAQDERDQDGRARARGARQHGGEELRHPHRDRDDPGDVVLERPAAHPPLDEEDDEPADQSRPRDGRDVLGQGEAQVLGEETARAGDREGDGEFDDEVPGGRLVPPAKQLAQPPREGHRHRHRGAGLDHDVEEVRLAGQPAGVLHEEEMAGRRNGEKLGDALDEAESHHRQPLGHAAATRRSALRPRPRRSRCR